MHIQSECFNRVFDCYIREYQFNLVDSAFVYSTYKITLQLLYIKMYMWGIPTNNPILIIATLVLILLPKFVVHPSFLME